MGIFAKNLYTFPMSTQIFRFLGLTLFVLPQLHAAVPENFLSYDPLWIEKLPWNSKIETLYKQGKKVDLFSPVAKNNAYWLKTNFPVTPSFTPATRFWFNTYSGYTSSQTIIHHKEDLDKIYTVLDFKELHRQVREPFLAFSLQNDISLIESFRIKRQLHFKDAKSANLLRVQTGQREHFRQGLKNFAPYVSSLKEIINGFGLPEELLALAFVESNFDTHASSSAGAEGVWQFMETTARKFMRVDRTIDYRRNALISSYGTFALLRQNHQILKRWDLALTAYNAGTPHLIKAKRLLIAKKLPPTLGHVFLNYEHPQLGFAVKNYYTAFLALSHLLPLRHHYFAGLKEDNAPLNIYRSNISFIPEDLFTKLPSDKFVASRNRHFLRRHDPVQSGNLIVTDLKLNPCRYQKLDLKNHREILGLIKAAQPSK